MLKCCGLCTLVYTDTEFAEQMTPLSADESVALIATVNLTFKLYEWLAHNCTGMMCRCTTTGS